MASMNALQATIEALAAAATEAPFSAEALDAISRLLDALEAGSVRAARRDDRGAWHAVAWVKQGILLAFRAGATVDMTPPGSPFRFFDRDTLPPQRLELARGVRVVPGGTAVRRGAYLAPGVVCMPPAYVNVGAWVGAESMVDSHALVGSCAQIGSRVHLSAAAQIGGVLEPVHAAPVVVEDGAFVGGNCGIYESTVVGREAVIAAGVILTRGTPVYDLVHETVYRAGGDQPLRIPAGAVVVPGARPVAGSWGRERGLSLQAPLIVKYRDAGTSAAVALEQALR